MKSWRMSKTLGYQNKKDPIERNTIKKEDASSDARMDSKAMEVTTASMCGARTPALPVTAA